MYNLNKVCFKKWFKDRNKEYCECSVGECSKDMRLRALRSVVVGPALSTLSCRLA